MKKLCIICFLFTILISNKNYAQVNEQDSLALVDLYKATAGANWYNKTNWLTIAPVATWYGINVNQVGNQNRVTLILLDSNNLQGSLPSSLSNLRYLGELNLSVNHLTGNIPPEIGSLNLSYLFLSYNELNGAIPSELTKLRISILDLSHNQLNDTIPSGFGKHTFTSKINLSYNQLTGTIPADLGKIAFLSILNLSHNQLRGAIPKEIGKIAFPDNINLSYNQLSGEIPATLANFFLNKLYLNNNQLSGKIIREFGKISLTALDLSDNNLSGNIPPFYSSSLKVLSLKNNKFTGTIPNELGYLTNLELLSLGHNELKGNIPSSLSKLKKLNVLHLRDNMLRDTVPSFLTTLPALKVLDVVNNHFTFDGMEAIALHRFDSLFYREEKKIHVHENNGMLSVYAGGTLSNNTYHWYKDGSLVSTKNGDSTFQLTASGNYYVTVTNSIAAELTLYSDTINISTSGDGAQSISLAEGNFIIYPNPAKAFINFYVDNSDEEAVVNVYDITGRKLITQKTTAQKGNIRLNITSLSSGTYFAEITIANKSAKQKFIKQ